MNKNVKWIGTKVIWEHELLANSPQDCQKLCSQNHNSSLPDQKCCFFNWDYYSGDCNLFSDFHSATCSHDGCHFISALWTCELLDYSKHCPGLKKLMVQNQNNRSLTRANHLSHSSKNSKFEQSKQFESIRSQRKQSKKRLAKSLCPN